MSPAIYAVARRSAALRSTDGSAPRTATITAQPDVTDGQTPIAAGYKLGATSHGLSSHVLVVVPPAGCRAGRAVCS